MTSLVQLIQESIPKTNQDTKYSLRIGQRNAFVMVLCSNRDTIPDFEEAMDMVHKFDELSPAEQIAISKRIAEIDKSSEFSVGYHHIGGTLVNIWVKNKKSGDTLFDVIADESSGQMLANVNGHVVALDASKFKSNVNLKESDL